MQNFMELNIKNLFHPKTLTFRVYWLDTDFWQFVTKHLINRQGQNTNVITCARLRLEQMWRLTKAKTEMKCEHWTKR